MERKENTSLADMQSHELLDRIIPHGASKTVAYHTHRSADLVRKWQRDPETEGGASSALDDIDHLMQALLIVAPLNVAWIPEWVNNRYRELISVHHAEGFTNSQERREAAAEFLQKAIDAVNALNIDGANVNTLEIFMQLHSLLDANVEKVRAELAANEKKGPRELVRA